VENSLTIQLNLDGISSGSYILKIENAQQTLTQKLLIE